MRIIHTSDWHLGHRLHHQSRIEEQQAFLHWLLDQLKAYPVDALVVAGDVFDTTNPSADALKLLYEFLSEVSRRFPEMETVIIGGNHDSAYRLDAPRSLLEEHRIHIIGGLPSPTSEEYERIFIPIGEKKGSPKGWIIAIPYLRPSDLPRQVHRQDQTLVHGVRMIYDEALERLYQSSQYQNPQWQKLPIVFTGHCYMADGQLSLESERKILGGNMNGLPTDLFPSDVRYVALGHLHLAQSVDVAGKVRYSGSPYPLSIVEKDYPHQVALVDLTQDQVKVSPLYVPRFVEMIQLPSTGAATPSEIFRLIKELPNRILNSPQWKRPFLKVCVTLDEPMPHLKAELLELLKDKEPRLSALQIQKSPKGKVLAEQRPAEKLTDLTPEDVFKLFWAREFPETPLNEEYIVSFRELEQQHLEEDQ